MNTGGDGVTPGIKSRGVHFCCALAEHPAGLRDCTLAPVYPEPRIRAERYAKNGAVARQRRLRLGVFHGLGVLQSNVKALSLESVHLPGFAHTGRPNMPPYR